MHCCDLSALERWVVSVIAAECGCTCLIHQGVKPNYDILRLSDRMSITKTSIAVNVRFLNNAGTDQNNEAKLDAVCTEKIDRPPSSNRCLQD